MKNIKLIIADDHHLFRDGLAELLKKHDGIEIVASVKDGGELMETLHQGRVVDIILLDLSMPVLSGFDVLKILHKDYPTIKTIVISMHDDGNYIIKCASNGAYGYLLKNAEEEELVRAIDQVSKGNKYYNQEITEMMVNIMTGDEEANIKHLSQKESEILQFLSEGLTTKEIAMKLFVSTRTIETHRANMLKKLEVKNTAELIKKATALHLI